MISDIDPVKIKGANIEIFKDNEMLKKWVISEFNKVKEVTIKSDNENILLSNNSARRATYKQNSNDRELNAVFQTIKETLEKAKYYDFEPVDDRHQDKNIQGQYVYYSKINIDNIPYQVRFKIDVPKDSDGRLIYAGHRIEKI